VAEALAETAVHDRWLSPFFIGAEKLAAEAKTSKTLSQLVVDVDSDEKLKASAKWVFSTTLSVS
jgi:redox-regulated HSP33 family molecular chaperone